MNALVLGLGNDILSDDAIGPKLVSRLERNESLPGIDFKTVAVGGIEVIDLIKDYDKVVIIDAIKSKKGIPGTVYQFTPTDFKETLHISSYHDMSFLAALEFAKEMDLNSPEKIDIIAIEIVEDLVFSDEFSPILKSKFEQIYKEVKELVISLI